MEELIIKITIQIFAVGIGLLIAFLDYVWHDKRTNKFRKGRRALLVLTIVFLAGSIWLTVSDHQRSEKKQKESLEEKLKIEKFYEKQIDLLQTTIKTTQVTLDKTSNIEVIQEKLEQITDRTNLVAKNNLHLSKQALSLADQIQKSQTGGDSYCIFRVYFEERSRIPVFHIEHKGTIPLNNVQISIEDLGRRVFLIEKLANNDYSSPLASEIIDKTYYSLSYPAIYPSTVISNLNIPVESEQNNLSYRIWIHLSNGVLFETLFVKDFRERRNYEYKFVLKRGDQILEKKE